VYGSPGCVKRGVNFLLPTLGPGCHAIMTPSILVHNLKKERFSEDLGKGLLLGGAGGNRPHRRPRRAGPTAGDLGEYIVGGKEELEKRLQEQLKRCYQSRSWLTSRTIGIPDRSQRARTTGTPWGGYELKERVPRVLENKKSLP